MSSSNLYVHRRTSGPRTAAAWDRRQVLMNNLRTVLGRAFPRLIGLTREPSWLLFEVGLPFLTTSAFVLVYRALQAPPEYIGFVVVGGAMTAFWLNVIWMMAAQLYWEKDQGNLELYFTAPMDMMAVLFGMAVGGMLASCLRAAVVLIVGSVVYGVHFSVDQWLPLLAVFFLTLVALYGLGMMLASLFVLWGREAFHMTQLLQEPMYFVSGLNFPVGQLGFLGALAIALLPLAVGLDAMRQLAFTGGTVVFATPSPGIEMAILVVMAVVFLVLARFCLRTMERLARHEGRLTARWRCGAAMAADPGGAVAPVLGRGDGFDRGRAERGGAAATWRAFATSARLGWQMEANWTDPLLFFIYSVAKPLASALILVLMVQIVSGGGTGAASARAFVVIGSALWSFVLAGVQGIAWSVLDDRERYRMLKYLYVSPSDFLVVLVGRGVARVGVGGMGALITLAAGVIFLGVPFDPARADWAMGALIMLGGLAAVVALGILMAAVCLQTRQESWSYPEAVAGALFLLVGAVFPLAVLPLPVQGVSLFLPLTWWMAGFRQAVFPATVSSVGGNGSLFQAWAGAATPDTTTIVLALLATTALVTLVTAVLFRFSERRAKDRGLIDRTTGS